MDVFTELAKLISPKDQMTPVQPHPEINGGLGIVEGVDENGHVVVTFNGSTFPVNATQEFNPIIGASVLVHFIGTQGWALGTGNPVPPQPVTPPPATGGTGDFPDVIGVGPPPGAGMGETPPSPSAGYSEWYRDVGALSAPWTGVSVGIGVAGHYPGSSGLWNWIVTNEAYGSVVGEWMQIGGLTLDNPPGLSVRIFDEGFSSVTQLVGMSSTDGLQILNGPQLGASLFLLGNAEFGGGAATLAAVQEVNIEAGEEFDNLTSLVVSVDGAAPARRVAVTADVFVPPISAGPPTYLKGAVYFDSTLNKLRVGGATDWETVTSV